MGALLAIIGIVAYIGLAIIWRGWVLSILWTWFLVPIGAPVIGIAMFIGVSATINMLTGHSAPTSDKEGTDWNKILWPFVYPLITLIIAWVVHQFV